MKVRFNDTAFKAKVMPKTQAQHIKSKLLSKPNADIFCHDSTDKDSANSALVVSNYLENKGIKTRIILTKEPSVLDLIDRSKNYILAKDYVPDNKDKTVVCVDFCSKERIPDKLVPYILNQNEIIGFDHHISPNLSTDSLSYIETFSKPDDANNNANFYVDSTAKSATSVLYRFYESLGEDIDDITAYEMFAGLVSDGSKKGYVDCNGETGEITPKEKLYNNKEAYEVYLKIKQRLSEEEIKKIAQSIDIVSNLSEEEKQFQQSLYDNLKFSKNNKVAYVEIKPNDPVWNSLGCDTERTSTILNRFRQAILNDPNYKNIEVVIVFYKSNDQYRMSAHSRHNDLLEFFKFSNNKLSTNLSHSSGGHPSRGGGRICSTDEQVCHKWVGEIIDSSEFYDFS